ncbi:peptide chain release factor N(5)-glutamine methyltransferase [Candidatus Poribacteria bacterium]|jgi:release factor glutamine methyltransferase|nr:peptide chain release factor N(5)-glutamine methyltransferase [Candidatus Poribacteria bacterium]MBT5537287.1 peptide chain release factor N(5)-glutamine methyltransferase [Candidatus Poribacteria bacterium]MBT5712944.1 peptide chain release factor N(5)-glutamine methyltransferase [Candidatus Poribacteria bacterium]MBT7096555.1 peptide chain release factor N(5)-glutamine methyltransferase [Candidatus Poribacteria bacterium]MBT7808473.1 peptide chain release factor N(5)-glutamine methyltransf
MADPQPWTARRLIEWTTEHFATNGIESARLDAELLLGHALQRDRMWLYLNFDEPVAADMLAIYRQLVKKRADRIPVAYLTGAREFYALPFRVTPDVLIPRPDTEDLVKAALSRFVAPTDGSPLRVADVGTGSGAIAISLAKEWAPRPIDVAAIDISRDALSVARENAAELEVEEVITFCEGDLLDASEPGTTYHAVVSNPPYIPSAELDGLEPEVSKHEPRLALDGGADGFDVIRRLAAQAPEFIQAEGLLALEVGIGQAATVAGLIAETGAFGPCEIVRDLADIERVVLATRS